MGKIEGFPFLKPARTHAHRISDSTHQHHHHHHHLRRTNTIHFWYYNGDGGENCRVETREYTIEK